MSCCHCPVSPVSLHDIWKYQHFLVFSYNVNQLKTDRDWSDTWNNWQGRAQTAVSRDWENWEHWRCVLSGQRAEREQSLPRGRAGHTLSRALSELKVSPCSRRNDWSGERNPIARPPHVTTSVTTMEINLHESFIMRVNYNRYLRPVPRWAPLNKEY